MNRPTTSRLTWAAMMPLLLAGDPLARQRFLYWTWTFDAFVKEAGTIHGKKTE